MITKTPKRSWSDEDKSNLIFGHQLGASIKTLSVVLDRTESALNKAIARMGIRQYFDNKKKSKKIPLKTSDFMTPERLRMEILEFSKKKNLFNNYSCSSSKKKLDSLEGMIKLNSLISLARGPCKKVIDRWVDLDFLIDVMKKRGYKIQRNSDPHLMFGNVKINFFLNDDPVSAAQLLIIMNRKRLEQGLEPIYVDTITEF